MHTRQRKEVKYSFLTGIQNGIMMKTAYIQREALLTAAFPDYCQIYYTQIQGTKEEPHQRFHPLQMQRFGRSL